ncbi:MAG TPA: hypothetical protein VNM90_23740 [Haliangium sp.]|nr:hypothetical protein [Haliangium sp.]
MHDHRLHTSRLASRSASSLALRLALAAVLCAAVAPDVAAQSPQRIGVVVSTSVNMKDDEVDELTGALGQALEQSLGVVVTAGAETRRRLPSGGLPEGCMADATCRADLGERLDADELLMLVVARVGSRVQLDATWIDVPSGKLASRPAVVLEGGADRRDVFRDAAQTLLPHLQPVPTLSEIRPATPAPMPRERRPRPARTERRMTGGAWLATGISVAALGGSLGLGYLNRDTYQGLDTGELCPGDRACFDEESETLKRNALVADGLAGLSAVAGVTALILYLTSDEPVRDAGERASAGRLRPIVGFGAGAEHFEIRVGGAF